MSFLSPWLLLGLLSALIPIAIHLFHRRRAVRRSFPAIEFLLRSHQRVARGLKLRRVLLLLARVGLFVLFPLAMAQPWVDCGGTDADGAAGDARLPATVVLVLDESASMTARAGGVDAWTRAVDRALDLIDDLRPWDRVAVVFAGSSARAPLAEPVEDRGRVRQIVSQHQSQQGGADLVDALRVARDLHARSDLPERRTVVLTDGSAHAWAGEATQTGVGRLQVFDLLDGAERTNHAVESLTWEPAVDAGSGTWRIDVGVRRWGASAAEATVTLEVDGAQVGAERVELPADGSALVTFRHTTDRTGLVHLRARVEDGQGAAADDEREASLVIGRAVRALLVNGDARAVALQDELYFLERALEATVEGPGAVDVRTVGPDGLDALELASFDAVVLANVATLPAAQVDALRAFVEGGGGLLITCGSHTDPVRWNEMFGDLLPKPIRDVKLLSERFDPDAAIKVTRVGTVDTTHPIFRVFGGAGGESLQSVAAFRYALLEPVADERVRTLASFQDGAPALLERTMGRGRVLLWTTSIDFDWTDLPIRTAFVPFVRRTFDHLARRAGGGVSEVAPGERVELDVEGWGVERVALRDPSGARFVSDVEAGRVAFRPERPGLHTVWLATDDGEEPVDELAFVVTPPAHESDPRPVDEARLEALRAAAIEGMALDASGLPASRRDLWPLLLFATLLLVYGETLLAVRRRVWGGVRAAIRRVTGR